VWLRRVAATIHKIFPTNLASVSVGCCSRETADAPWAMSTALSAVLGLRQGIRQAEAERKAAEAAAAAATAPNSAVENAGGSSNGAPLQSTTAVGANKSVERFDASKS
jgi:hypothetical protein